MDRIETRLKDLQVKRETPRQMRQPRASKYLPWKYTSAVWHFDKTLSRINQDIEIDMPLNPERVEGIRPERLPPPLAQSGQRKNDERDTDAHCQDHPHIHSGIIRIHKGPSAPSTTTPFAPGLQENVRY
jgi:hypothetical protein